MTLLYVEDDATLAEALKKKLSLKYNVEVAGSVSEAAHKVFGRDFSLIITDYFLPDMTGIDLCHMIRSEKNYTPILFLTINDSKENIVQALDSGADDYLSKPFSLDELEARIRVLIQRKRSWVQNEERCQRDIKLCTQAKKIECAGESFDLPRQEYILLEFFYLNAGRLITRQEIYEQVWGSDEYYNSNTIDVHVRRLREKLKQRTHKNHIQSIYGMGYRFINS